MESMYKDKQEFLQSEWASNFFTDKFLMESRYDAQLEEKDNIIQEKEEALKEQESTIEETVKNLLKQKFSIEDISNITKLNIENIKDIINKN